MAYNNNRNDANSLAKSHSKVSNFKLTLLCLLSSLALCACICFLALTLAEKFNGLVYAIVSGVVFVITCTWFSSFKR